MVYRRKEGELFNFKLDAADLNIILHLCLALSHNGDIEITVVFGQIEVK